MRIDRVRPDVTAPWLAACALSVAIPIGGLNLGAGPSTPVDLAWLGFLVTIALWAATQATVGTLIVARRPENRIGRLLQLSGLGIASVFGGFLGGAAAFLSGDSSSLLGGLAGWWASIGMFPVLFLAFPIVGMTFPDGKLPGPRWRLPVAVLAAVIAATSFVFAVAAGPIGPDLPDNPFGVVPVPAPLWAAVSQAGILALLAGTALAVGALATRWRRGSPAARAQVKWLIVAIAGAAVLFPLTFGGDADAPPTPLTVLGIGSVSLVPIAIGIAVLRYRLYEIDRLISRTIAWALVTGFLVTTFAGLVLVLQAILAGVTQGETVAVAASTLVAFALFQPLRRRVQALVDRRFDRVRADAERLAADFSQFARDEVELSRLLGLLLTTTSDAVRPANASVWIRPSRNDLRTKEA